MIERKNNLQRALEYLEAGCYREAIDCFQVWINGHPNDADAKAHLAYALSSTKQGGLAWATLKNALKANPDSAVVQRIHALLLIREKKSDAALNAAHRAFEMNSNNPENQVVLAAALGAKGQYDRALALLESALKLRPNYAEGLANRALLKLRLGDKAGALRDAESALAIKPHLTSFLPILATLRYQAGNLSGAIWALEEALKCEPNVVAYLVSLGEMKRQVGDTSEAILLAKKAISLDKNNATAWVNLGAVMQQIHKTTEAREAYANALVIRPDLAEVANNLGVMAKEEQNWKTALTYFKRALGIQPENIVFLINYAATLTMLEKYYESEQAARKAVNAEPGNSEALCALAGSLTNLGRFSEAESYCRQAIVNNQKFAEAYTNLGIILEKQGRPEDADLAYKQAIYIKPDCAEAWNNRGFAFRKLGQISEAEFCYQQAQNINPNFAEAHINFGGIFKDRGRFSEAESRYRQALQIKPDSVVAWHNLLFVLNYIAKHTPSYCLAEARKFGESVTKKVQTPLSSYLCSPEPDRLRVGLVSGDLRNHPVGHFLQGILAQIDPSKIELSAYLTSPLSDDLTARIKPYFSAWKTLYGKNDEDAAKQIHNDGVHVLMDLSGHTDKNRLPVFAWKPAPIQASWLGYFATTGLTEMDYLIGDPYVTPLNEESHFTEKVWRFPETYLCFTPPDVAVNVHSLPALSKITVTFGCFNSLAKINDNVLSIWARILKEIPTSRLFLKTKLLNDRGVREEFCQRFVQHGIPVSRLLMEGDSPRAELLAAYNRVDIALDPFPYPGGTTSIEALWMGVPVLTHRGDRFLSHIGETIAHNAGLSEWIADDDDDYVAKAVAYAADLGGLSALRAGLRQQVLDSPLFDAPRFADHFEDALWTMWQHWQENQGIKR